MAKSRASGLRPCVILVALLCIVLQGPPVDGFQYVLSSPTYEAVSAVTIGGTVLAMTDDTYSTSMSLPFTFNFYGKPYTSLRLHSDGFVTFDETELAVDVPEILPQIPTSSSPNSIIALWATSNMTSVGCAGDGSGNVAYYGVDGTSPTRTFILSLVQMCVGATEAVSVNLHLNEADSSIELHYPSVSAGLTGEEIIGVADPTGVYAALDGSKDDPAIDWTSPLALAYVPDVPKISALTTVSFPDTAGGFVTIIGEGFGTVDTTPQVTLGGVVRGNSFWISDTWLLSDYATGTGSVSADVSVLGRISTSATLSYSAPSILLADAPAVFDNVLSTVTVIGNNFGANPDSLVFLDSSGAPETCDSVTSWTHRTIVCEHTFNGAVNTAFTPKVFVGAASSAVDDVQGAVYVRAEIQVSGTLIGGDEEDLRLGGKTLQFQSLHVNFDTSITELDLIVIGDLVGDGPASGGWNEQRVHITASNVNFPDAQTMDVVLPALAGYEITADETITVDFNRTSFVGALGNPASKVPITILAEVTADLIIPQLSSKDVIVGSSTIGIQLHMTTFVSAGAAFDAIRQDIIDGIGAANAPNEWDTKVNGLLVPADVVRTSDTYVTVTLPAVPLFFITDPLDVSFVVPPSATASGLTLSAQWEGNHGLFRVSHYVGTTVSGNLVDRTNNLPSNIQAGGATVDIRLWGMHWKTIPDFTSLRQDLLDGINVFPGNVTETHGWQALGQAAQTVANVARIDERTARVTLSAVATYAINAGLYEDLLVTVPQAMTTCDQASVGRLACSVAVPWTTDIFQDPENIPRIQKGKDVFKFDGDASSPNWQHWTSSDGLRLSFVGGSTVRSLATNSTASHLTIQGRIYPDVTTLLASESLPDIQAHLAEFEAKSKTDGNVTLALDAEGNAKPTAKFHLASSLELYDLVDVTHPSGAVLRWPHNLNNRGVWGNVHSTLSLTESETNTYSAVWFDNKENLANGFEVEFAFRATQPSLSCHYQITDRGLRSYNICKHEGESGFAFLLQDGLDTALGNPVPESLGYLGMTSHGLAFEFNTDKEQGVRLRVVPSGATAFPADTTNCLASLDLLSMKMTDDPHTVKVTYGPTVDEAALSASAQYMCKETMDLLLVKGASPVWQMTISIDGVPLLALPFNLSWVPGYSTGDYYAGFTSSTSGIFQRHDIISWSLTRL